MRKAIVDVSTGVVENVILIEPDIDYSEDGKILIDAEDSGPGWTWDGTGFIATAEPSPSRLVTLLGEGPATQVYDEATDTLVDRPAEDIAADKAELLGLLQTKLAASEDLTWEQMNKMLALERES